MQRSNTVIKMVEKLQKITGYGRDENAAAENLPLFKEPLFSDGKYTFPMVFLI